MYCHICGTKNSSGEDHCQKCGTRLKQDSSTEEQIWSEPSGLEPRNASATGTVSKRKSSPFVWIIPLLLAAIMGALLAYYYNQENLINAHVKTLHLEAEKAATGREIFRSSGVAGQSPRSKTECRSTRSGS